MPEKPPLMRPYDYDEKHLQLPCFISPKLDGVRAFRSPNGMMFRSGHPIFGAVHIRRYVSNGTDGEMLIPGMPFAESAGLIRSHANTPEAHFYVFDNANDPNIFRDRYYRLKHTQYISDKVHVINHTKVYSKAEIFDYHNSYLAAGFEGSVLKTLNHTYRGMKDWNWMRIVPVKSVDLKVIGVYEGTGKYTGMMGGIECQGEGVYCKVGTGFDDKQRKDYWEIPGRIVGWTVRVKYKNKTKDGSLRQPSFDRRRHSK